MIAPRWPSPGGWWTAALTIAAYATRDRARLRAVDPSLKEPLYTPATYHAVVLIALAAVAAGGSETEAIRDEMVPISAAPGTSCETFAGCAELLVAGEEIDYDGLSGPVDWDANGDPTAPGFAVHEIGDDNQQEIVGYRLGRVP